MLSLKAIFARRGQAAPGATPSLDSTLNLVEQSGFHATKDTAQPQQQPTLDKIKTKKPRKLRRKQWPTNHSADPAATGPSVVEVSQLETLPSLEPASITAGASTGSTTKSQVKKSFALRLVRFRDAPSSTKALKSAIGGKTHRDSGVASAKDTDPSKGLLAATESDSDLGHSADELQTRV